MSLKGILNGQTVNEFANAQKEYLLSMGYTEEKDTLDSLTPSFLPIMNNLPAMSQEIVYHLVMTNKNLSDFITTDFLSKKMREPSKVVSVYCKSLFDIGMVERQKVSKGYEYKISSEIFFNWFLMRYELKNKRS